MARIQARRAFTLVEAVVSLGTAGILMTGLGSSIMLATRALPTEENASQAAIRASTLIDDIVTELLTATVVTERTATTVAFTVADRDADENSETIRYSWSGTPGDPLMRKYNNNAAVSIADNTQEFALVHDYYTTTTTTTETVIGTTPVTALASFDTWSGIPPTETPKPISSANHLSQCFQIAPPPEATSLTFTRAMVTMYRDMITPSSFNVAIHRPSVTGATTPAATPIASPTTILAAALSPTPVWMQMNFSGVTVTDLTNVEFCLVLSGSEAINVWGIYDNDRTAPANGTTLMWSTDAGGSWKPASKDINKNDLKFYVYGTYESSITQEVTNTRYFMTGIAITARFHESPDAAVRTTAHLLNAPEVAAP